MIFSGALPPLHTKSKGHGISMVKVHPSGMLSGILPVVKDGSNADVACDRYHRYVEDAALMKKLGLNAYRFSISWPRIYPHGHGEVNQKGLDYYSRLVDCLIENGITPMATLFHWDLPLAIHQSGGWLNRRSVTWFEQYARTVIKALGDRVKYWIPINEPNVHSKLGYRHG